MTMLATIWEVMGIAVFMWLAVNTAIIAGILVEGRKQRKIDKAKRIAELKRHYGKAKIEPYPVDWEERK